MYQYFNPTVRASTGEGAGAEADGACLVDVESAEAGIDGIQAGCKPL